MTWYIYKFQSFKAISKPNLTNLDIVGGKDAAQFKHLQHGGGAVIGDAVTLQDVLCDHHLPGQPALPESSIEGENVRQVTRLTTAAAFILLHAFGDGLHFSLLAVGSCGVNRLK